MGILNLDERLKIIEKAEPETAKKLRERYLIADRKGKENMRWLIDITAEKLHNKNDILLPFIPRELIWGELNLGKVLSGKKELYNFYLKKEQLLKHLGVFGSTGSGKTNFIHHLIKELAKQKIPVLIFDFSKQNYRNLLVDKNILEPGSFNFNPLNPPAGTSKEVWAKKFAEVFDHAYWLLGGGKSIIFSALNKLSDSGPTLSDLRKQVGRMDSKKLAFRERNWIATAKRALDSLCLSGFSGDSDPSQLLKGVTVFELEELVDEDKTFFIEIVLQWLRNWLLKNWEKGIAGVIILEESHYVLNREKSRQLGRETVMDRLFREIRGLGMGIVFTDQHPSLISYPALGNSATQIYMRLKLDSKHSSDIEDAARMLGLDKEERSYLSKLHTGYGIIRTEQFPKPFLLKFPLVEEKKPTNYDIKKKEVIDTNQKELIKTGEERRPTESEPTRLTSIELEIIRAIGGGDAISTKQLADALKISGNKLKAHLKTLADSGFVRVKKARAYRNTTHFHFLTEKGVEVCRKLRVPIEMKVYEGFHTQMKEFTIKTFREEDWNPADKRVGEDRYVDIALEKDGRRKLIEIETGSNSNEWVYGNIDKCVKAQAEIQNCDIHFLCTSKSVKNRIIQQASKYALDNNTSFRMFVGDYIESMENLFSKINWEEVEFTGDNNPAGDSNA